MGDDSSSVEKLYEDFIHISRYAKWLEDERRRETWEETTRRYVEFFAGRFPDLSDEILSLQKPILEKEVMPSMRAVMTAGKALEKSEVANYNCAYVAVDHPRVFDEILFILMNGTGVGFSVERQYVQRLPEVAEEFYESDTTIVVPDSKIGWATSFRELVSLLYSGKIPKWDLSRVRPSGARLKTFGGRASGPEPLNHLFHFAVQLFRKASGRKLNSIECHDLVCKIAEIVVVGGVRRSALISLSNLSDDRMRNAKNGQWWAIEPQRQLANNSAVYTERPELDVFLKEWKSLYESKSGERGIFSRVAAKKQVAKYGKRDSDYEFGTNPCSEIILRSAQFCNLSEVVVRRWDTLDDLKEKARVAAILGTLQSTMTNFKYLRKVWQRNCEEERLLGVSLTGIMDHLVLCGMHDDHSVLKDWLSQLREVVVETNKEWAEKLGISASTAVTAVKPSGTVSQLVNCASGIHARFSSFYIRRVRIDKKDPLCQFMQERGFPGEQDKYNSHAYVFEFPVRSPESSVTVDQISSTQQLEIWKVYQDYWCEHKPSCSVYYSDESFMDVGAWVWRNFDQISGISFMPQSDHVYEQAPYEAITEEEYYKLLENMPKGVDWQSELTQYEKEDTTQNTKELQCSGGSCEVVDLL